MKSPIAVLVFLVLNLHADDTRIARMLDDKLNIAQRNDACYDLRGEQSVESIAAMVRALEIPALRSCAARNLREAGAADALKQALANEDPEIRAASARELGALARPELIGLLAAAARDSNLLVATNAFEGLTRYPEAVVLPRLLELAESGGPVAAMALSRAVQFHDARVLPAARRMESSKDVPLRLAALSAIADLGDESDLPALRQLAAKAERVTSSGRGFGLVPALDLSRAAQNAIRQIESRKRTG